MTDTSNLSAKRMTATTHDESDDWLHLKPFGYAPGGYLNRCSICENEHIADKRAVLCRSCAEKAHAEKQTSQKAMTKDITAEFIEQLRSFSEVGCPQHIKMREVLGSETREMMVETFDILLSATDQAATALEALQAELDHEKLARDQAVESMAALANLNRALQAENERLRNILQQIVEDAESGQCEVDVISIARAALKGTAS